MGRHKILIGSAAFVLVCGLVSALPAQTRFSLGARVGRGAGVGAGRGIHSRGFVGPYTAGYGVAQSTVFDLYKLGHIPVPPYFALHPPVYYADKVPQNYGGTPFAFPHTWWQQYGYSGAGAASFAARRAPTMLAPPQPVMIQNPFMNNDSAVTRAETNIIENPFLDLPNSHPGGAGTFVAVIEPVTQVTDE